MKSGQKIDKLFLTHWDTFHLENEFLVKILAVKKKPLLCLSSKLGHFDRKYNFSIQLCKWSLKLALTGQLV